MKETSKNSSKIASLRMSRVGKLSRMSYFYCRRQTLRKHNLLHLELMPHFHLLIKSEDWSKPHKDYRAQFVSIIISRYKEMTWSLFVWFFTTKQFHRLFGGKSRIDERGGRFYSFFNWLHVKDVQMRWRTNTPI